MDGFYNVRNVQSSVLLRGHRQTTQLRVSAPPPPGSGGQGEPSTGEAQTAGCTWALTSFLSAGSLAYALRKYETVGATRFLWEGWHFSPFSSRQPAQTQALNTERSHLTMLQIGLFFFLLILAHNKWRHQWPHFMCKLYIGREASVK